MINSVKYLHIIYLCLNNIFNTNISSESYSDNFLIEINQSKKTISIMMLPNKTYPEIDNFNIDLYVDANNEEVNFDGNGYTLFLNQNVYRFNALINFIHLELIKHSFLMEEFESRESIIYKAVNELLNYKYRNQKLDGAYLYFMKNQLLFKGDKHELLMTYFNQKKQNNFSESTINGMPS